MPHLAAAGLIALLVLLAPASASAQAPYEIPPDNPFVNAPGARGEVYVLGLRNPFRWSFDRLTGDMWIGDVGAGTREEITRLPLGQQAGRNLGWNCREGTHPGPGACSVAGAVGPVYDYDSFNGTHAVTGGYVVRDPTLPAWRGRYLFADVYDGIIRWLDPASPGTATATGVTVPQLVGFGEDGLGRLHVASLSGNQVLRLAQGAGGALRADPVGAFTKPVAIAGPPGDPSRLFVAEQGGALKVRVGGSTRTFLTVETEALGERGLLAVAFRPDYATSGKLYVFYTRADDGDLQLDEYTRSASDPNVANPASRRPVLRIEHSAAPNHNGGQLLFGRDGHLYLSTGDGGGDNDSNRDAQRLDSLLGKILRIDVTPPPGATPPPPVGDTVNPTLTARVPARQRMLKLRGVVAYARCSETCVLNANGRLKIRKRTYRLRGAVSGSPVADRRMKVKVKLTKRSARALRRALRKGRKPSVRVGLRARDTAGLRSRLVRKTVRVKRPRKR